MNLVAIPAFADNVIWMLHDGRDAAVVDPGDAAPVASELDARGLRLAAILVTHHHPDHVGGIAALRPRLQGPVWGPAREAIPAPFVPVNDGDSVEVLGHRFEVLDVPGHTAGHVAYAERGASHEPLLFCGDTLFSAGCGRLFEGTPAQMAASLARLAALPDDTRICCAHEYTLSNLAFAAAVEPGNPRITAYTALCQGLRTAGRLTLPAVLGTEREINPFLRCRVAAVVAAARAQGAASEHEVDVFAALRDWKNRYR
ncbi:hydroxyacylglutathione hydrolase [Rubrivivax gelatinosus]|uniref:Hydroxyacylglutathione hydrolase n=1 Tax=Rubrivivax gelatinosus (strain NBRC 100245 / IL144) TaxID=983917 RepID=I0HUC7_RUBGI|nr:hydroxyacylglutathione hydrolase [Rubrivivax gelatinosus]BAL96614.1 hydroxyacylglutathione hydrolase GloB [Rubrivivax gelatinosus IL144]